MNSTHLVKPVTLPVTPAQMRQVVLNAFRTMKELILNPQVYVDRFVCQASILKLHTDAHHVILINARHA